MLRHTTLCTFVVVIMAMGSIYAQGRRSAYCDGLTGSAYGLCNAYCEAKKCGSSDQNGSDESCTQIYDNFKEVAPAEIDMPCGGPISPGSQVGSCPCNFNVQFWTSKTQIVKTENATDFTCTWLNSSGPFTLMNLTVDSSSTQDILTFVTTDPVSIQGGTCAYDAHFNSDTTIITTPGGELLVTPVDFPACVSDIAALRSAYLALCGQ